MVYLHLITREGGEGFLGTNERVWQKGVQSFHLPRVGDPVWPLEPDCLDLNVTDVIFDSNLVPSVYLQTLIVDPTPEYDVQYDARLRSGRSRRRMPRIWRTDEDTSALWLYLQFDEWKWVQR